MLCPAPSISCSLASGRAANRAARNPFEKVLFGRGTVVSSPPRGTSIPHLGGDNQTGGGSLSTSPARGTVTVAAHLHLLVYS